MLPGLDVGVPAVDVEGPGPPWSEPDEQALASTPMATAMATGTATATYGTRRCGRRRIAYRPMFWKELARVALNKAEAGMFLGPSVTLPRLLKRRSLNTSKMPIVPFFASYPRPTW